MKNLWLLLVLCLTINSANAQNAVRGDVILGLWKADDKVLTIQIYRLGKEYRARIISFTDHHSSQPSDQRVDAKNPNPALRSRKMLGMDVLTGLAYDSPDNKWIDGILYHASSGRKFSAAVELEQDGKLSVRAYKGISLLGKTVTFHR